MASILVGSACTGHRKNLAKSVQKRRKRKKRRRREAGKGKKGERKEKEKKKGRRKEKKQKRALAGMDQWTECQPANQRVTGSIPNQGTCLGCRPGP